MTKSDRQSSHESDRAAGPWLRFGYLGVLLIAAFSVAGNLYWTGRNIVLVGRDASGHLERTLKASEILQSISPSTLFQALTLHDYRPPLLYIAAVPFYRVWGVGIDSAQLLNITLFCVVLLLTYLLGRRITGAGAALFAVLLTSLMPMMVAMARLFYMEQLLTTFLLIGLMALLRSQDFDSRGWALAWGGAMGGALLVKWTAPIYLLLPVLYFMWRAGLISPGQYWPQRFGLSWRRLLAGGAGALIFLAIWYWPNRALIDELPLGAGAAPIWALLMIATVYILSGPRDRRHNFWGALAVALLIASLWYVPRIDFLQRLGEVAFGTDRGNQESVSLLRISNYTRYFAFWITHHMGPLAALIILPPALWVWFKRLSGWRQARPGIVMLWLAIASALLFLTLLAQANPRNLVPLVPLVAILLADSLGGFPKKAAVAIGAIWVVVLALQWSVYTFDALADLQARTPRLWVSGDYLAWPATGSTDPAFWIQPHVLATIGDPEGDPATLGMLADSWEIHRGSFRYLIAADELNIELMSLTEPEGRGWSDMLANQWILLMDGENDGVREPGLSVLNRILAGDPLFDLLYEEVERYALPNGANAILYLRREGPADPYAFPVILIETTEIADAINRYWSEHATLYLSNRDLATWVGIHDLRADRIIIPESDDQTLDDSFAGVEETLLVVTRYDTSDVQAYLRGNSRYATEIGDGEFVLTVFGRPTRAVEALPVQAGWPGLSVSALNSYRSVGAGQVLPIDMVLEGQTDGSLKASIRLVGADGTVVAQRDEAVTPAIASALLVPPQVEPGVYTLGAVLYDPNDLTTLPDEAGRELAPLTTIEVEGE